jgi:lipopolysaccharide heptosyltransferase II
MVRERRGREVVLPDAARILVIETGLVGELLVVTPALRAIRASRPRAEITALVSPGSAQVLVGNPNVDRLLPLTKAERAGAVGIMRLATWIRAQRFEAAFVFHTSFRSALVAALGGVPWRAGLDCEGRGFLLTHRVPRDRSAYEVDEHLRVVGLLGVPPRGRELEIHLEESEREEAAALIGDVSEGPLVGLHPGASREIRRWPAERFAELGARLSTDPGASPVFAFGPREKALARTVEAWHAGRRLDAPRLVFPRSVRILAALFERMDAVVTNNTGPMHIAAAVGTPGVFIHGPTPVERWQPPGERFTPVFARSVACRPCDSPRCARPSLECMEAVSVDEVWAAARAILAAAERAQAAGETRR